MYRSSFCGVAVLKKKFGKGRDLFWAFMNLEKAYDSVDRDVLFQATRVYGVGGNLLKAVQSFYVDRKT